ncbi:hypothetical protein ElyMa_005525300 [Elysia marginata]|uniref:Uncharacterized protein n=1 Tax=Elysia marginata TaxID=1093978 RepID=A0AAV4EXQ7_9GAST|nr:hypothetical protein ElyMa_005525300 [Elysia marginata]
MKRRPEDVERYTAFSKVVSFLKDLSGVSDGSFIQFVGDNVDHNLKTLEGLGTFHGMGIIGAVTPGEKRSRPIRRDTSVNANQISTLGQIPVHFYNSSKTEISLRYEELQDFRLEEVTTKLDLLWKVSWPLRTPRIGWSGLMQAVSEGSFPGQSTITFLSMIDIQPTNMSFIYSTLLFVSNLAAKYKVKPILTFDQPLWWKAQLILDSEPADSHLRSLILQLGGFHTQMNYLGTIGHLMTGSGLRELLEVVYAPDGVVHMLSGKAVARAARGHLLVDSVLNALLASSAFGVDLQSIVREEIDPARTATDKTREVSALHSEEMEGEDNSYSIRDNINDSSLSSCLQLLDQVLKKEVPVEVM